MELGWVDFSKTERDKVLNILDLLEVQGVLDELGIAPIRDGYSNLFFPGTTTIQTRAKYFFIVPYAFRDLEFSRNFNYLKLKKDLENTENNCAKIFLGNNPDESGVIGRRAIQSNSWVKRPPSSVYWAGLRKYGFFKGKMSIDQYVKYIAFQKQNNANDRNLGNSSDESHDDKSAGDNQKINLFNISTYRKDWMDNLEMKLTYDEGQFLKTQITDTCPNSIIGQVLKNNMYEFLDLTSFSDIEAIVDKFPEDIQKDYGKARDFSEFTFALNVVYNMIVSQNRNRKANKEFSSLDLKEVSAIDIDYIMNSLNIFNPYLRRFLNDSKSAMEDDDLDELERVICNREIFLKGPNRSKTAHPGEYDTDRWFVGDRLDYRFTIARTIVSDIYESEEDGD